jgi:hypothetical protein
MPLATKCFEDPSLLDERDRFRAMSLGGVVDAVPMLVSFAQWRVPGGGTTPVLIVGTDLRKPGLLPWNIVAGDLNALAIPGAVAVDQSYCRSRPRPSCSPRSIGRGLLPGRRRTRRLISWSRRRLERTLPIFKAGSTRSWIKPRL